MTSNALDLRLADDAGPMTQAKAQKVLAAGSNAFLTGPPGAGKSYLIERFVAEARKTRKVAVTASTGIAGTHIGGTTLHSWAGLGVREDYSPKDIAEIADKSWVAARVKAANILVIDEVSMLHPTSFDAADRVCQTVRKSAMPFGGLQVILCGDFFQLPPVSRDGRAQFIYDTPAWAELNPAVLYLCEQFRQTDDLLLHILNAIRAGEITEDHREHLLGRIDAQLDKGVIPTRLHTHNVNVDRVNAVELAKLKGKPRRFDMRRSGPEQLVGPLLKSCLAPEMLELREGAAVMFIKNNFTEGYINGTLGTVIGFEEDSPVVRTDRGAKIVVETQTWETEDIKGRKTATLTQLPLRLAWAISVHKSQGMSLSAAEIDLSRAFVEGLGYVALSRVTTLDGIRLLGLNDRALAVSETARRIDHELQKASAAARV